MSTTESPNEFFTKLVWGNLWNPASPYYLPNVVANGIKKEGIDISPLGNISLASVPPSGSLQLMKSSNLLGFLPIKTGYIGIEFSDVEIQQIGSMTDGGLTYTDDPNDSTKGSITANIDIPDLEVSGNYVVVATGLAQCAIDTAGLLSFLPGGTTNAVGEEAAESGPTVDNCLTAATNQRTKLWQTPNGDQLMNQYYDYNEVYNWMFQNDPSVQTSWQEPANTYFMEQTYNASNNTSSMYVNDTAYNDTETGEETSYNQNAFSQQITLTFSALGWAANPPSGVAITSQQFSDAATAAASFGSDQVHSTGNTENQTTPMTFDDVYTHVEQYQSSTEQKTRAPLTLETLVLTDWQRAYLKKIHDKVAAKTPVESDTDSSATLVQGTFSLVISSGQLTLDANLTFPKSGNPTAEVTSFSADFSVSSVDIHNISDWTIGKLASIGHQIEKALSDASFIQDLLSDKTNDALESDTVMNYLSTWINKTMAQVLGPLTPNPS